MDAVICNKCKRTTAIKDAYSMEGSLIYCECGCLMPLGDKARKARERRTMEIKFEVWNDKWVFDCSVCGRDHYKNECSGGRSDGQS